MQQQLAEEAQQEHQIWNRVGVSVAVIPFDAPLQSKFIWFQYVIPSQLREQHVKESQADLCAPTGI